MEEAELPPPIGREHLCRHRHHGLRAAAGVPGHVLDGLAPRADGNMFFFFVLCLFSLDHPSTLSTSGPSGICSAFMRPRREACEFQHPSELHTQDHEGDHPGQAETSHGVPAFIVVLFLDVLLFPNRTVHEGEHPKLLGFMSSALTHGHFHGATLEEVFVGLED